MEEQKQQILVTALELFKKYGIKSVSIEDISHEMSMSKKTFYQYFQSKEELIEAVLNYMTEYSQHAAQDYMRGKSTLDCIKLLMDMHKKVSEVHKEPVMGYDLRKYYPQLYKKYMHNLHTGTKNIIEQHLHKGIEEGIYRSDLDVEMCAIMYSMIQQAYIRDEEEIRTVNPKRMMQFIMESFFRSIISKEGIQQAKELLNKKTNK